MTNAPRPIHKFAEALENGWATYRARGEFDVFVEFVVLLNGLAEQLHKRHLPGLVRHCQELENTALTLFAEPGMHPVPLDQALSIERKLTVILDGLRQQDAPPSQGGRRCDARQGTPPKVRGQRRLLMISQAGSEPARALAERLEFFGFQTEQAAWNTLFSPEDEAPLAAVFIPDVEGRAYPPDAIKAIVKLRSVFPGTYIYCLGIPLNLQSIILLQRAGADTCLAAGRSSCDLISHVLDLIGRNEQDAYRVLIVEDSATATAHVRRALEQHTIDSHAINDPRQLLEAAAQYRPDVILMDMYMPFCTGVEATSALRQVPEYRALPVIYLSSETDIAQQVEALRLGGDQFLTKPANPIILASVVKTKIERYREMLYTSQHDSLTGLLNHLASKTQVERMALDAAGSELLAVAMLDIDRFKSINDTYGHPVGDQVIRSLGWLLRGRLRSSDLIGRYGGEEFIVALPGVTAEQAFRVLDQVRDDFSRLPHAHAAGVLTATFSCGVAVWGAHDTGASLIAAADDALLEAKRSGRNRVMVSGQVARELLSAPADAVA